MKSDTQPTALDSIRPVYRLERFLRKFRDGLWVFGAGWTILALVYAMNPIRSLNTATIVGAWLGLVAALIFIALNLWIPRLEHRIVIGLRETSTGDAVVMLLNELDCDDEHTHSAASRVLVRLIPSLHSLIPDQLDVLQAELLRTDYRKSSRLVQALLHAIERFGDADSIPVVEEFQRSSAGLSSPRRTRLAAERCVTFLSRADSRRSPSRRTASGPMSISGQRG